MTDRIDAALMGNSGRAYFFKGSEFVRWAVAADKALGPPEAIGPNWPGIWPDGIDAAINWRNGKAYFFKGPEYIRYDLSADKADEGWPKLIADHWPGLWPDGIDAALMGNSGRAYFFKGPEVIRWQVKTDAALGPAEPIAANWAGVWADGIDAAINWRNGKAYFFRGAEYIRYDLSKDKADDDYPMPIAAHWPGLWTGIDLPIPGELPGTTTGTTPGQPPPVVPGGSPVVDEGCRVTPLIRFTGYYPEVEKAMNEVAANGYILLAGWRFDPGLKFAGSGELLVDLLKRRARDGVDVRVLAWAFSPNVTSSGAIALLRKLGKAGAFDGLLGIHDVTIRFVRELRSEPAIGYKACLNVLAHPAGAAHMKFAMVGDEGSARVFTGGIDLHPGSSWAGWYDVQLLAEGPIATDCHRAFADVWNELISRPVETVAGKAESAASHDASSPSIPNRVFPLVPVGTRRVRSLRTLPAMRLSGGSLGVPQAKPLGFAPNGATDVARAVRPMLEGAKAYAYLEDQFLSSDDVMSWLNAALKKSGDLRVVLVTGRPDPGDPPTPIGKAFARAVNDHLLDGIADPGRRIAVLQHLHHVVHAKLAIVDDREAVIGSANWARRGLYTDIEHSLHFEDPVHSLVGDRQAIWAHHLGSSPASIPAAVDAWFAIPIGAGHSTFERLPLPIRYTPPTATEEWELSTVTDPDSRQSWPPLPPITIPGVPGVPPIPPVP